MLSQSNGFLCKNGVVVPSALEMLMAELSLPEEGTMMRRKKKVRTPTQASPVPHLALT